MKNLFLSLALVLVGTFAFANVNLAKKTTKLSEDKVRAIDYTLTCGYSGSVCCMSEAEMYAYISDMEQFMCN